MQPLTWSLRAQRPAMLSSKVRKSCSAAYNMQCTGIKPPDGSLYFFKTEGCG